MTREEMGKICGGSKKAPVSENLGKHQANAREVHQTPAEKIKKTFANKVKEFWNGNITAISRVVGIGTAGATLFLFDKFILGGHDLALEGLKVMLRGNVELLGWIIGLPATVCIEGLVLFVGYCVGRSLDPDHQSTEPSC